MCVGRVGRLAVVLGVGTAVVTGYGCATAAAETDGTASASSSSASSSTTQPSDATASSSDSSPAPKGSPTGQGASHPTTGSAEPGAVVSTGGAHTSSAASSPSAPSTPPTESENAPPEPVTGTTPSGTEPPDSHPAATAEILKSGSKSTKPSSTLSATTPTVLHTTPTGSVDTAQVSTATEQLPAATVGRGASAETAAVTVVATADVAASAVSAAPPPAADTRAATVTAPVNGLAGIVSSFVNIVLSPFAATTTPDAPAETPALWALLAFARREIEQGLDLPTSAVGTVAAPVSTEAVTDSLSVNQAIVAAAAAAPPAAQASTTIAGDRLSVASTPATFTGEPTIVTQVLVAGLRLLKAIGNLVGLNLGGTGLAILPSTSPPSLVTLGLHVQQTEFDGWQVWTLAPASPSGKYIVGLHGGGFSIQPTILHWYDYASIARNTGATVVVPIYPLVQEGGTAATVVPQTADLISSLIDQHGADAVSVYGDSAGANIALAAAQELVRRGDPTPARMVLISPVVDLSLSNPAISLIDDPVLDAESGRANGLLWSGGDLTDPLASPLFGSLEGLPQTWVYTGSLELLAPDVLRLQDKAIAQGADVTFILRKGEIHDWAGPGSIIPFTEGAAVRPQIYRQLVGDDA
jgi:triacylglycerol lipase